MANSLSAEIQEIWDKRYQVTHYKVPVYPAVANLAVSDQLETGDTLHRGYINELMAVDLGTQGSYTRQNINDTDESLSIDQEKETSFYLKELDKLQNHLPTQDKHAGSASKAIFQRIDAEALGEANNFSLTLDDGDLGGTSGNGVSVTASNVNKLFTISRKKCQQQDIMLDNLTARFTGNRQEDAVQRYGVGILSPTVYQRLLERVEGKDSVFGDKVGKSGHAGQYMGYELFVSNNVPQTTVLDLATIPTDGDTITINGTQIRFKTSLAANGDVHICSDVDKTRAELAEFLNDPTTDVTEATDAGIDSFAKGSSDHKNLDGITATNDNSADTLTVYHKGVSYYSPSSSGLDAADGWDTNKQRQHLLFGLSNAIDVAVQQKPTLDVWHRDGYAGWDVVTRTAYGTKVFNESVNRMVSVEVDTSSF